ncbi:ATPase [Thiocystis minor]|uniref:DUF6118 family protein n=1 Tax=Thiocystis minor TaxID=61597 RepID=UPI001913229F|nr:DUF6118 family protein [Thiocystis minor]MBK5966516.1 ATPase [Thiocystis minor]
MTRTTSGLGQPSPEIITVVSQKEGIGATATAINLALALAATGRRVLLMDLDPEGRASHSLGYDGHGRGCAERALLDATIAREMIVATGITELYLSPASAGLGQLERKLALMGDSHTRLYQAIASLDVLSLDFDHVVLDCPPSLDLLTQNALVAAHRVLMPLPCDSAALNGLPRMIQTISQLRAGLPQPLYGLYLLMHIADASDPGVIARLRQDYGRMTLLSEIPVDDTVKEADESGQPILIHASASEAGQAYLSLAAEWLTMGEQGDQPDGTWHFKTRQDRMAQHRVKMSEGIDTWRVSRSSRLYDPEEAARVQDSLALEALFQVTRPPERFKLAWRPGRITMIAGLLVLLAVPSVLWLVAWMSDDQSRIELGARLIGSDRYWRAGSALLARADENAYREILFATRLVAQNREQLMICGEQARERRTVATCTIDMPTTNSQP